MKRLVVLAALCVFGSEAELRRAYMGKNFVVKIDMPGSQRGVDLYLDRDDPMDWRDYSQRIKNFGVSIPKGRAAMVTAIVVKKDNIEFQLDGGGYGTFGDDTDTSVSTYIPKTDYERRLERDIRNEADASRKASLERDLSRERSRRQREESANRAAAATANAIKRQEIMEKRLRGGSRFNIRHVLGAGDIRPEQLEKWLEPYVEFGGRPASVSAPRRYEQQAPGNPQLRRGMSMDDVRGQLGRGKLLSESIDEKNLNTQQWEFLTNEFKIKVTSVDGLVIRYSMESR
ncbi:MAG: hypothetical protein FJW38_13380 [Acidobacteria bacterium]|nr:hypothetical protein [Acidobacteriota bacterium]